MDSLSVRLPSHGNWFIERHMMQCLVMRHKEAVLGVLRRVSFRWFRADLTSAGGKLWGGGSRGGYLLVIVTPQRAERTDRISSDVTGLLGPTLPEAINFVLFKLM